MSHASQAQVPLPLWTENGGPKLGNVDAETMLSHCLSMPGAWPDNPWDHEYPVVKVGEGERGRIFAFVSPGKVGVKCGSRDEADEWLDRHPDAAHVMAYIGRSGWNDLDFDSTIDDDELFEAVEESYRLVVAKLPKKYRP